MKKCLLVLVAVLMSVVAMAQAPQKMTYQAVVRDNDGRLVSNGNVGVKITIVRGSETGAEVYSQTETVRTNANGLFTMMIGGTGFDAIDWSNGPYYLKSEVDPNGGNNYILTTTQQMVSVPYALHAGTVDNIIGGVNFTETDPVFTAWDKDYNDLINKPTIPTNVSELTNDAGYLTSFTETQVLSISNDTIYLTGGSYVKLPAGFSGDYNDLTNRPSIADSVSRIINEYHFGDTIINYISQNGYVDSSYVINYNAQQGYVDTTYVTNYINNSGAITAETDPVFTAWNKDYNDLINKPTIPTVPFNVSEFTNDAGYLTSFTEAQVLSISNDTIYLTGGSYVKLPAGFSGDYNDLTNKPTIPTVPTNVSEFTNDAGYLISFSEAQVLSIGHDTIYLTGGSFVKLPAGFSGDYNDLTNKPTIPTVPTNVSEFTNDAGYITATSVPTNVSELTNDAGYLTSFTEAQVLSIGHDTIYLTGGSYVKLPAGFSGDYNDLTNKPTIPTVPTNVSEFTNDAGYLTSFTEAQVLSISNDTIYLTGGGYVKLPAGFSGDYNDLTNKPTIPTVPTNVGEFTNDAGYITSYSETDPVFTAWNKDYNDLTNKPTIPTVPSNVSEFTNDAGYITTYTETQTLANVAALGNSINAQIKNLSDPTENLDAVNLQTLNSLATMWSHRFDSLAHRFDSIAHNLDSIISYQDSVIDTLSHLLSAMGASTGDTTAVECDSFIWYGTTYLTSGDYEHRLTNVAGFDSILTMHLTINHGTYNTEYQTAADSYTWHGTEYSATGNYTYSYTNAVGCLSVDTLHLTIGGFDANGASTALFSVSSTKQVRFSKGNLQYTNQGSHTVAGGGTEVGTWRFAEHQYDCIGNANSNISSTYDGWIDLFGFGTSGWNSGKECYHPWDTSTIDNDYFNNNLRGSYANADWGVYNAISNGGNQPGMWRTLTESEFYYLIFTRSGYRYTKATVNGVAGLIIFPDGFSGVAGWTTNGNYQLTPFSSNVFDIDLWSEFERIGCVFLPIAGRREGSEVSSVGEGADYRCSNLSAPNILQIANSSMLFGAMYKHLGGSVRLVMDVE